MKRAIIFDFDGVIVMSEESRFKAIRDAAKKNGITIDENKFQLLVGKTTKTFLNEILIQRDKIKIPAIIEFHRKNYKENIENFVQPVDLTVNFIKNYKGKIVFAIASMSERHIVEKILKKFDIYEKFTTMICQGDVTLHKPHPEIYLKTLQQLDISPGKCVAIEDTVVGVEAALSAGLDCYVILNGINNEKEFQNKNIKGFIKKSADLEKIVIE